MVGKSLKPYCFENVTCYANKKA